MRTSRNLLPALQWRLADLNPDLLASSDGGSNQILVRHPGRIVETRRMRLAERPERRRMIWTRVELPEGRVCVANLHASAGLPRAAADELMRAAGQALEWAAGDPLVLGGDFNLRPRRDPEAFAALERALRSRRAHRARGDRPPARPRAPRGGAPAAPRRGRARAGGAGRGAYQAL